MRVRITAMVAILFLLAGTRAAGSDQVSPTVGIDIDGTTVSSRGTVTYYCGTLFTQCSISFDHALRDIGTSGSISFSATSYVSSGSTQQVYNGSLQWFGSEGNCYQASVSGVGSEGASQRVSSGSPCIPYNPPPPPPNDDDNNCGGACSPIIIDIDGDGYDLTAAARGVSFDIDGDGSANRISWTRAGSDDAFLWLDGNGNGVVDSGMELFGDAVYDNGFDKLKTFDGNGDGVVDASDVIWPSLRLWLDSNHNGISEAAEVSTIASSHFTGIGVEFKVVGKRDKHGNRFRYKGRIYTPDDPKGFERVYDVIFVQAQ